MKPAVLFFLCSLTVGAAAQAPKEAMPFRLVIESTDAKPKAGSDIWIKVTLTNNSMETLDMSGGFSDLTHLDPNYHFEVRSDQGRPVPKRVYPHPELTTGTPINRTIQPNETFAEEQRISALYDMTRPGAYLVQVSRRRSDNPQDGAIKSNTITIVISK